MSTAPWRSRVPLGNQNNRSVSDFRLSYPELSGMRSIVRGEILTLSEVPRKRFNFLVNPSDISTSYGTSDALDLTNPNMLTGADLTDLSDGLNTASFTLLLDRTYEVHNDSPLYRAGVLHDVLALEQVLGIPNNQINSIELADTLDEFPFMDLLSQYTAPQFLLTGLIVKKYLRVLFGSVHAFSFDGFVDSLSVHYTHFSHRMVPTRAGVSISMRSIGVDSSGGAGPTSSSAW